MKDFKTSSINTFYLSDDALYKTYISGSRYKTSLLGLDPGCDKKFKIYPVAGKIYPEKFKLSDVRQGNLGNCAFVSALRAIMRRYPQAILNMIKDSDEKHIEVRFYSKDKERRLTSITYKIDKTIVIPAYHSLYNMLYFFSFSQPEDNEKLWVKLIEKALVLHFMKIGYPTNLENIQHYGHGFPEEEGEGVIPSYEDVITVIGRDDIYFALLGCQVLDEGFYQTDKPRNIIKQNFNQGELVNVNFFPNEFGLEENHVYELVDFAKRKNEKFVILSNPWGFNQQESKYNYKDMQSFNVSNNCSLERIKDDKGIFILSVKNFYKIVRSCKMTYKIIDSFGHEEKPRIFIDKTELPKPNNKPAPQFFRKSSCVQFFKPAAMIAVGAAITGVGLLYLPEITQELVSRYRNH